ncbi:hypothetical protein [Pseudorhodoferax sp.]|uniref:hypothetical protein n=1 Tax=Pseudorhodoferax sp. TaxID=1993553 RepID=UPI002DD66672|nr:hypothetical protein [Pseudorhodoferax sp.]
MTTAKKTSSAKKRPAANAGSAGRLLPKPGCVTVRLYRVGHGDCFLLAFPPSTGPLDQPVYVLIDCGYKPGSSSFLDTTAKDIVDDIRAATGGRIDVVVVTHEHQDHVNGFTEANFQGIHFGECWFAWTEDPDDDFAERLRKRFGDRLQQLQRARLALAAAGSDQTKRLDEFLAFELGGASGPANGVALAATAPGQSANKRAMKLVRAQAQDRCRYLVPHTEAQSLPRAPQVRVFPLGPPKDEALLHSLNPVGDERFPERTFAPASVNGHFAAALGALPADATPDPQAWEGLTPFAKHYAVALGEPVLNTDGSNFSALHYGSGPAALRQPAHQHEVADDAPWRRIDGDWLRSAEELALAMNKDTNNGSLVLAFELGAGGKVLLFAADAQRGNWISWPRGDWRDGSRTVTARDLLARTVLYKVGHHGSHNATLHGQADAAHPNLDWMGRDTHAAEFTAMITAVEAWAKDQDGWHHPLPAIKKALLDKARGRVFQTDTALQDMQKNVPRTEWEAFLARADGTRLYLDYTVEF